MQDRWFRSNGSEVRVCKEGLKLKRMKQRADFANGHRSIFTELH